MKDDLQVILDNLPSMSPNVEKLLDTFKQDFTEPEVLETLLIACPVIAGRVLQISNSSFYGLSRQINSLREATIILGQHTLRGLIYSLAVIENFKESRNPTSFSYENVWLHSLYSACLVRVISDEKKLDSSSLFTAALFQHFGLLVYEGGTNESIQDALDLSNQKGISLQKSIIEVSGIDYMELSSRALHYWNFPDNVCVLLETMDKENKGLEMALFSLANTVASAFYKSYLSIGVAPINEVDLDNIFPNQDIANDYLSKADTLYIQMAKDFLG